MSLGSMAGYSCVSGIPILPMIGKACLRERGRKKHGGKTTFFALAIAGLALLDCRVDNQHIADFERTLGCPPAGKPLCIRGVQTLGRVYKNPQLQWFLLILE